MPLNASYERHLGDRAIASAGDSERVIRVAQLVYDCIPGAGSDPGIGWHSVVSASKAGIAVHALTKASNRDAIESVPTPANVTWHFIDVPEAIGPLETGRTVGDTAHLARWLTEARDLCTVLAEKGEIDLTHFVTFSAFWMPVPFADIPVPHVFGPVGGGERIPRSLEGNLNDRLSANLRSAVQTSFTKAPAWQRLIHAPDTVVVSAGRATTERLVGLGATVFETGATGVLTNELIADLDAIEPLHTGAKTLVMSGRQLRWKGHDLAIQAMSNVLKSHPDARLDVLGTGPQHEQLKELVAELGLGHAITFHTNIGRIEERRRIAGAACFIFPSRRDTGSTLVPVVQVLQVPIAAFATGAIPASTGGFASLADPVAHSSPADSLSKAIIAALDYPADQLLKGRAHAIDRHGEATASAALRRWYEEALSLVP